MLGATSVSRHAVTVASIIVTTIATAPAAAPPATRPAPAPTTPKCEGCPRHAWTVMTRTSTRQARANTARTTGRRRSRGTNDDTQVIVASVSPNDTPNVAGLRSESGPLQDPPVASSTPTCTRPLTPSAVASR